ncbi:FAD binding domain-containing protein [Ilyonectria robusta]|uniref:FAD binding domain-containing protein n=1 Tax=Ilyonectria robusta TaxID=1079257 RepID=UPI001E8E7CD9|nr:FAD binding domain-containing protein [Ilyonectria robusta]KAH8685009.1 FAD binding domain-containing protein [Ilyonectria robusta]
MSPSQQLPIIIVGAGIVGLTLAQALKKEGIPFQVYERDRSLDARSAGWGLSIYWALSTLENCLPPDLFKELDSIQVDPQQSLKDTGRYVFLDLETAEPRYVIPPSFRRRVSRLKLRKLLAKGIDVRWDKCISGFKHTENGISVFFTDGTEAEGSALVAADGSGSKIRQILMGDELGCLNKLPAHYLSATLRLTEEEVNPLRNIDPLMFQGSHPDTGFYLFYSLLSTPEVNGSSETDGPYYEAQFDVSWAVKGPEDHVPETNADRLAKMRSAPAAGTGFEKTLREIIENIPEGTVTLVGDAAHAMTMYRGQAANHGITDAANLTQQVKLWHQGKKTRLEALADYETEMIKRGYEAVILSRQACLDSYNIQNLRPDSPLVGRR